MSAYTDGWTLWIRRPARTGGFRSLPLDQTPQPVRYQAGSQVISWLGWSYHGLRDPSPPPCVTSYCHAGVPPTGLGLFTVDPASVPGTQSVARCQTWLA